MPRQLTRREMIRSTALASAGFWLSRGAVFAGASPNERLDVAAIGIGGRGRQNLMAVYRAGENIVGVCDVDGERAAESLKEFKWAETFHDFRRMLDRLEKKIDAVVVSTPDHTHAPAGVMAMKMGKHCYCEKPLTHCVHEARVMADVATENKVVTQIGTQHHATPETHRVVEMIRAGVIGPVRECHVWIGGNRGGGERPTETPPVPPHLKWDLWLGPRPERPYHPAYVPYRWRFWWDFGTGETGNNGVHIMDYAFWALELRHPATVEAEGPPVHAETSPRWMHVRYAFPARGHFPPLRLDFYHAEDGPPVLKEHGLPHWESGVLFVGAKGLLLASYGKWKLYPEDKFAGVTLPEATIPDSIGHHKEWIEAAKTGGPTTCPFGYSGPLTEMVLLGNVAYRVGEKLQWDAESLKATNCPEAERYIKEDYRRGWTL